MVRNCVETTCNDSPELHEFLAKIIAHYFRPVPKGKTAVSATFREETIKY